MALIAPSLPARLLALAKAHNLTIGVAESLTGGRLASKLVDVPGSSAVFRGGVVAYATDLKANLLGVDPELLQESGPVHAQVAAQMASGVAAKLDSDIGLATTGFAGPEFDPHAQGLLYVACVSEAIVIVREYRLAGTREAVRNSAVNLACALGLGMIGNKF